MLGITALPVARWGVAREAGAEDGAANEPRRLRYEALRLTREDCVLGDRVRDRQELGIAAKQVEHLPIEQGSFWRDFRDRSLAARDRHGARLAPAGSASSPPVRSPRSRSRSRRRRSPEELHRDDLPLAGREPRDRLAKRVRDVCAVVGSRQLFEDVVEGNAVRENVAAAGPRRRSAAARSCRARRSSTRVPSRRARVPRPRRRRPPGRDPPPDPGRRFCGGGSGRSAHGVAGRPVRRGLPPTSLVARRRGR